MKKPTKLPLPKEDDLAKLCVRWFRLQYPDYIIHHSANEGKKHVSYAIKLRDMGLLTGFPDLLILYQNRVMFIELKRDPKMKWRRNYGLSDDQFEVGAKIMRLGHQYNVAYSLEDFQLLCRQKLHA